MLGRSLRELFFAVFFFFQAEDGIRDVAVTGVQTCALPISRSPPPRPQVQGRVRRRGAVLGSGDAERRPLQPAVHRARGRDRKSTRLNSSHGYISYAVFCLKKKKKMSTKIS